MSCRQTLDLLTLLRAGGKVANGSAFGVSSLPFSASNVQCFGREYSITDCRNESTVPAECTVSRGAAARCVPGSSMLVACELHKCTNTVCNHIDSIFFFYFFFISFNGDSE